MTLRGVLSTCAVAATFALVLACEGVGASPAGAASIPTGGVVTYIDAPASPLTRNFNPNSTSDAEGSVGLSLYQPLFYFDAYSDDVYPLLGTKYTYTGGGTVITVQLRHGVKWSDGTPFTASDVLYTYEAQLKYPAIDLSGINGDLKSVSVSGDYTVRFTLDHPDYTFAYYLLGSVPILPAHIWQGKNPVTYTNPNPVTTGPFILGSFSPTLLTLKRNPHYWGAPEPYISEIRVPIYLSNTTADLAMAQGNFQFAIQFIPDIETALIDHNPKDFHYWFPAVAPTTLYTNDGVYPLNLTAFRQALSAAIDRQAVSTVGEFGYEPVVNGTGLPLPAFASWVPKSISAKYPDTYSPSQAKAILKKAGFKWSASGQLLTPKGQPVSLTVMSQAGASDYVTDSQIIVRNLEAIGIDARATAPSPSTEEADLADGDFQLAIYWTNEGPGPYYIYDSLYGSVFSAPEGKIASSNYERWDNPETDKLLAQYAATNSSAQQHAIMAKLETIVASQLPTIPLVGGAAFDEYNTADLVGWPSAQDPYDAAAMTNLGDMWILMHIHER